MVKSETPKQENFSKQEYEAPKKSEDPKKEEIPEETPKEDTTESRPEEEEEAPAEEDQEELLNKAQFDEDGNTRVAEKMPSANVIPKRVSLTDYQNRLNTARSKSRQGNKVSNDVNLAKQSRDEFKGESYNGRLPGTEVLNAPHVRSTPGEDDAPSFSTAEKVAVGDSEEKHVVEKPANQSNNPVGVPDHG